MQREKKADRYYFAGKSVTNCRKAEEKRKKSGLKEIKLRRKNLNPKDAGRPVQNCFYW
jgi:hypothetical protein